MDEQEIRRRYFIQPEESRESENRALCTLIGPAATDKFCLQELLVDGTATVSWPDDYAVAVVLRGSGQVRELTAAGTEPAGQSGEPLCTLKPGDQLFIPADAGPLLWTGQLQVVICRP
jgi:mannose-6-phosphate isomerase class I